MATMFPLHRLRAEHALHLNHLFLFLFLCHPEPTTGDWPEAVTALAFIHRTERRRRGSAIGNAFKTWIVD